LQKKQISRIRSRRLLRAEVLPLASVPGVLPERRQSVA
jgi:hypothetical protein